MSQSNSKLVYDSQMASRPRFSKNESNSKLPFTYTFSDYLRRSHVRHRHPLPQIDIS